MGMVSGLPTCTLSLGDMNPPNISASMPSGHGYNNYDKNCGTPKFTHTKEGTPGRLSTATSNSSRVLHVVLLVSQSLEDAVSQSENCTIQ